MSEINNSPFHAGEKEMQARVGKSELMEKLARFAISTFLPDQHREFYAQLPFFVAGSVDNNGWPWASILSGKPGFFNSPDSNSLDINVKPLAHDPLNDSLKLGAPLGLLGIELPTRRRNRVNARVSKINSTGFSVEVDQAFGNCPQYIQIRTVDFAYRKEVKVCKVNTFTKLDELANTLITAADTFFVSSFLPIKDEAIKEGVDVSHRGGKPGFIKLEGNSLTIPDYPGNNLFNTMGNFLLNPKAGLTFIDFETGDLLMMTGKVEILDGGEEEISSFKGAERGWRFTLDHGLRIPNGFPFDTTFKEYSQNTLFTGDWKQAKADLAASKSNDVWRTFSVARIENESSVIRSLYLKPIADEGMVDFKGGQFITIGVRPEGSDKLLTRTYTISSAPGNDYYRISVKREPQGIVSNYLHDAVNVGDVVSIKNPVGEFFLDPSETHPAVLLAGGVGITPMISMAQNVMKHAIITRHIRPLHIFYAARTQEQQAFATELKNLETDSDKEIRYYPFISQAVIRDDLDESFNVRGHISAAALSQKLSLDEYAHADDFDYDFYLCGPAAFMQSMYDNLITLGVSDNKIFAESFGPSVLIRISDQVDALSQTQEAESAVITFTQSDFQQSWSKGDPTLLEVAENHGLSPNFSCRNGVCGACAVKLKSGSVAYRNKPNAHHAEDEILICCTVPAEGSDSVEIEL